MININFISVEWFGPHHVMNDYIIFVDQLLEYWSRIYFFGQSKCWSRVKCKTKASLIKGGIQFKKILFWPSEKGMMS